MQENDGTRRSELVAAHVAMLFAGIEILPGVETWPLGTTSSLVSARWVEAVIAHHLDRIILRMLDHSSGCTDCLMAWVRHFVRARIVLSEWAWARDVDDLLF